MPDQNVIETRSSPEIRLDLAAPESDLTVAMGMYIVPNSTSTAISTSLYSTAGTWPTTWVGPFSTGGTASSVVITSSGLSVTGNVIVTGTCVVGGWDGLRFYDGTTGTWIEPVCEAPEIIAARDRARLRAEDKQIKTARGAIKRAVKLMSGLGFEPEINIFLRGQTVEVSHAESDLKFLIKKYENSLISRTLRPGYSTPYQLQLWTKTDIHLANLCVYMENTPVIDQVLGLVMFIKSGSEEHILRKANFLSIGTNNDAKERACMGRPWLRSKLRMNSMRIDNAVHVPDADVSITGNTGNFIVNGNFAGLVTSTPYPNIVYDGSGRY